MKSSLFFCTVIALTWVSTVSAQNVHRCEINGATVYSETPCNKGRVIAPTQDSDAQKQRSIDSARKLEVNDKQVSQQINQRANREAKERAAQRKIAERARIAAEKRERAEKAAAEKKAKKAAKGTIQVTKIKPTKPPKREKSAKAP